MWVCKFKAEDRCWEIGWVNHQGIWQGVDEREHFEEAAARVSWLNGGLHPDLFAMLEFFITQMAGLKMRRKEGGK